MMHQSTIPNRKKNSCKDGCCQLIYYLIEKCQRIDERGSLHQSEEKWHNWAPPITEALHCIWRAFCQIAHEYQLAVLENSAKSFLYKTKISNVNAENDKLDILIK